MDKVYIEPNYSFCMSRFRTRIKLPDFPFSFNHDSPVMSIGSCFAEHMHQHLSLAKIPALLNPFGIIYNPHSIAHSLAYLLDSLSLPRNERGYTSDQLVYDQGRWHSLEHHGHFSKETANATLKTINESLESACAFLPKIKRLILTFGTSKVYVYNKTQTIVANCHKIPAGEFTPKNLSIREMTDSLSAVFAPLKSKLPELEIILTVSPVRHIKDGMIEQQRNKARLLLTCEELTTNLDNVHYFPSYEILMDELRDYRFYAEDMVHPNKIAVDYIWELFGQQFFDTDTAELIQQIQKIQKASEHRPFNPTSKEHQTFVKKQLSLMEALESKHPQLNFSEEYALLKKWF